MRSTRAVSRLRAREHDEVMNPDGTGRATLTTGGSGLVSDARASRSCGTTALRRGGRGSGASTSGGVVRMLIRLGLRTATLAFRGRVCVRMRGCDPHRCSSPMRTHRLQDTDGRTERGAVLSPAAPDRRHGRTTTWASGSYRHVTARFMYRTTGAACGYSPAGPRMRRNPDMLVDYGGGGGDVHRESFGPATERVCARRHSIFALSPWAPTGPGSFRSCGRTPWSRPRHRRPRRRKS